MEGEFKVPRALPKDLPIAEPRSDPEWSSGSVRFKKCRKSKCSHHKVFTTTPTIFSERRFSNFLKLDQTFNIPYVRNQTCINIMSLSQANVLAIALGNSVYLWNLNTNKKDILVQYKNSLKPLSVEWINGSEHDIAISTNKLSIEIWNCISLKRIRILLGHSSIVSSIAWNKNMLVAGDKRGFITYHDISQGYHEIKTFKAHNNEIMNIKSSLNFDNFASVGFDGFVKIWSLKSNENVYSLKNHNGAVKGLAWCPWQSGILATGGIKDNTIKIWNVRNGKLISSYNTGSEVRCIIYSEYFKNLISAHGKHDNIVQAWHYESNVIKPNIKYFGHNERIMQLTMTKDKRNIITAGADQLLILWNTAGL